MARKALDAYLISSAARLEVFKYEVPPLRQRPEDIEVILERLLESHEFEEFNIEEMAKKQLLSFLKKNLEH